jgi:hypothetical protein
VNEAPFVFPVLNVRVAPDDGTCEVWVRPCGHIRVVGTETAHRYHGPDTIRPVLERVRARALRKPCATAVAAMTEVGVMLVPCGMTT